MSKRLILVDDFQYIINPLSFARDTERDLLQLLIIVSVENLTPGEGPTAAGSVSNDDVIMTSLRDL